MKNIKVKLFYVCLAVAPAIASCTHSKTVTEKVDQEVQAEPEVPPGTPAAAASRKVILNAKTVTPKQRQQLLDIHGKMASDVATIRGEMAKLQVILFKKVLDPQAEEAEIKNIRSRLIGLDRKRTNRILSALDEAQLVIGVNQLKTDRPGSKQPLVDSLEPWKMM